MGRLQNDSNAQSGRLVSSRRNHVVVSQAEPDSLQAGKDDCQTPRRPLDQACLQLEPKKGTGNKEDLSRDEKTKSTSTCGGNNDLTSDMTWLTHHGTGDMGSCGKRLFFTSRIMQPTRTSITTTTTTQPTNARPKNWYDSGSRPKQRRH